MYFLYFLCFPKFHLGKSIAFQVYCYINKKGEGRERAGWWSGRRKEKEGNEEEGERREEVL